MAEQVQNPAENPVVEPDTTPEASPAEETQTDVSTETEGQDEAPVAEAPAVETEDDAERKPSRAERRIRQLVDQAKQKGESQPLVPTPQQSPSAPFDITQYADENGNLDVGRLNQEIGQVVQNAQAMAQLTVQQQLGQDRAVRNVEADTELLPTKYAELNPDSDSYLPAAEQAIAEEYQEKAFRVVGYDPRSGQPITVLDPSVRLADIADRYMKVAQAAATKHSATMKNAVAQTADEAAVRPQGESKAEKPFEELSIPEMEAKLGTVRR